MCRGENTCIKLENDQVKGYTKNKELGKSIRPLKAVRVENNTNRKQKTKSARYLIQTFFMEGKIETLPEVLTNKELTTLGKIILPWKFLSGK